MTHEICCTLVSMECLHDQLIRLRGSVRCRTASLIGVNYCRLPDSNQ
jgi:hypothetical protein